MGDTTPHHTKPPVDYGPFPWWSEEILYVEYVEEGKTKADLAREWGTTWDTINAAIERHGIEEVPA